MWVFGYGSLVWKVEFPYEVKLVGYIKGYLRRFYQHSIDHRGVPEKIKTSMLSLDYANICSKLYNTIIVANLTQTDLVYYGYWPGRVVTLVASNDPSASVWGVAYKIKPEDIDSVTKYLDYREKNGYSKKIVTFLPKDKTYEPFDLTLYIATEDNESFAGPATIQEIAKQVVECNGPSGPNKEYVYNLAAAMRQLAPDVGDDHLFTLEKEVRKLDTKKNVT